MKYLYFLFIQVLFVACQQNNRLPFLGEPEQMGDSTVYPTIADFSFLNQDSQFVSNRSLADKIYIADFIFLSCPTICPVMTREMYKAYEAFEQDNRVVFVSHTIDPVRDTIPRLKSYAENLGAKSGKWHFLTGNQDEIIDLAEKSYFATALPDSTAPGGFVHSGGLLLIDRNRHIRGVYNGTKPEETERLISDIKKLLKEEY
ncbi:SCO family protein [Gynurincola endophyticus]|uniref:SCO family protein n=1 Tax=Gynurincola endophyticus TaxID=2479004 RepID=UPI000F8C668C|nr:SCO family protein [Gynurincola endophyticus]